MCWYTTGIIYQVYYSMVEGLYTSRRYTEGIEGAGRGEGGTMGREEGVSNLHFLDLGVRHSWHTSRQAV